MKLLHKRKLKDVYELMSERGFVGFLGCQDSPAHREAERL